MKFKKLLGNALDNNIKIIIKGRSGWGKSEMIQQVAEEKGLELIDFRLSEVLPEDIIGIPKVVGDYYEYIPPKWLYEVLQNPEKKYLLFLDEITQGTPDVLNICYKIFDKVTKVGNHTLNNVYVVGATNYSTESNYLSELPEPLKKRACMLELDHNAKDASTYLIEKFDLPTSPSLYEQIKIGIEENNPRSMEKAINLILNSAQKELVIPFIGFNTYCSINSLLKASLSPKGLTQLDEALNDVNRNIITINNVPCVLTEFSELKAKYQELTEEELQVLETAFFDTSNSHVTKDPNAKRNFFTLYAVSKNNLSGNELLTISKHKSFNAVQYITQKRFTLDIMTDQFEVLKSILGMDDKQLLRKIVECGKTLTIDIMKVYRESLPWDLYKIHASRKWLTDAKMKEFEKELEGWKF